VKRAPRLRGVTWGHRRAIDPLVTATEAYERTFGRVGADWSVRDLKAFEHQPLAEAVADCDLLVFDHPFIGEIAGSGLFRPVDDCVAADDDAFAGPSLATYRWHGQLWGAPVDAATMNAIYRDDLLRQVDHEIPQKWQDVIALGDRLRRKGLWLGLANGDHHGFLAAGTLMHNAGASWGGGSDGLVIDRDALGEALSALAEANAFAPPECLGMNSIALHDAMTSRDDIAYCPMTYGYATYGEADFGVRRLSFGPSPGRVAPYEAGTLIGGAAIGITAHCRDVEAAKAFVGWLVSPDAQLGIFAQHHGQPAIEAAWIDPAIDRRFNGYFSAVHSTLRSAAVRPRFRGFGRFERVAGQIVGRFLGGETTLPAAVAAIVDLSGAHQPAPD